MQDEDPIPLVREIRKYKKQVMRTQTKYIYINKQVTPRTVLTLRGKECNVPSRPPSVIAKLKMKKKKRKKKGIMSLTS